jgi:uroporphyrinogen-III synthase
MSDLSDLADVYYDILAFFSPTGIKSLFKNFPSLNKRNQNSRFGSTTQRSFGQWFKNRYLGTIAKCAFNDNGLRKYILEANKGK